MARLYFDNELNELKKSLLSMADKSQEAMKAAMSAFISQDLVKAKQIIEADNEIDALDHAITEKVLLLIAKEAPVATDLRKINVALKVSGEIERMGDEAVNIAKSAMHIGKERHIKEIIDIPKMMDLALEMVSDSMTAYYAEDIDIAHRCAEKDDQVDKMFGRLVQELMIYIPENPKSINQIIQLSFVCRFIERIADHSTNIAENVVYLVTGKLYNLNA